MSQVRELAKAMNNDLFARRNNVQEAYDYAASIAKACGKKNEGPVLVAIHVMMNTIAAQMERRDVTDELVKALEDAQVLLEASYLDHEKTPNGDAIFSGLEKVRAAIALEK